MASTASIFVLAPGKERVGRIRARSRTHPVFGFLDGGFDDLFLFFYRSVLHPRRGVQSEYSDTGFVDIEIAFQRIVDHLRSLLMMASLLIFCATSFTGRCSAKERPACFQPPSSWLLHSPRTGFEGGVAGEVEFSDWVLFLWIRAVTRPSILFSFERLCGRGQAFNGILAADGENARVHVHFFFQQLNRFSCL